MTVPIRVERPEFVCWDFDEYARILAAAREDGPEWYAAVCLAGEAGLRVGEVRAPRWKEDVDLIAGTITVNQQIRQGMLGTPKGRTRRTVPRKIPPAHSALSLRTGIPIHAPLAYSFALPHAVDSDWNSSVS